MSGYHDYKSRDGLASFTYDLEELPGCCGAVCATCLIVNDKEIAGASRKKKGEYAAEIYEDMAYHAYDKEYRLLVISSLTAGGVRNWDEAYVDSDAPHKSELNLRHVAQAGGMVEGSSAINANTGNEVVLFTGVIDKPTKEKEERVDSIRAEESVDVVSPVFVGTGLNLYWSTDD